MMQLVKRTALNSMQMATMIMSLASVISCWSLRPRRSIIRQIPTSRRRLQPNTFTSFTDSQLDRPADDASLGCLSRFPFSDEVTTVGTKAVPALVADKTIIMPLPSNCTYHNILQHWLLASKAPRSCATGVALQAPCKAILLYERRVCVERLEEVC